MGNVVVAKKAKKEEKRRKTRIDHAIHKKRRDSYKMLLIGNPGTGKSTFTKTIAELHECAPSMEAKSTFSYHWNSFKINEFVPSDSYSSAKYGNDLNVMLSVWEQNMNGPDNKEINYNEPNQNDINPSLLLPILISGYYKMTTNHSAEICPEDIIKTIIYFIPMPTISSCKIGRREHVFELWDNEIIDQLSLHPLFKYCSTIIFFADISGYNEYIHDYETKKEVNKLVHDLNLFEKFINMDSLRHTEIVLMLNKIDLFKEKIETVPLNECELFSDFDANIEEWQELYEATTRSIQDKFLSVRFKTLQ